MEHLQSGADGRRRCDELRRRAADQRAVVRWWAAECRARNAICRACFTAAHVAAATEARRTLRTHAAAWRATRAELRTLEAALPREPRAA